MTNIISALTARTQLGQIMRRASQRDERFVVGRRGEPKIIILGLRDYVRTLAPPPSWLREVRKEARRQGVDRLSMREISREVTALRRGKRTARRKR